MTGPDLFLGLMSGTSMDGVDAVLIQMDDHRWLAAEAHAFVPYPDALKHDLLALQQIGENELHRSQMLAQQLSRLYAEAVNLLLAEQNLQPADIRAIGCHGQTIRHAPEAGYSIQIGNLALLAELTGIFTIGDFRSRDLAAGGQGALLVRRPRHRPRRPHALPRRDRRQRPRLPQAHRAAGALCRYRRFVRAAGRWRVDSQRRVASRCRRPG